MGRPNKKSVADYKAISLHVGHANMEITDQFYSNINDGEVKNRISELGKETNSKDKDVEALIREFMDWKRKNSSD